MVLPGHIAGGYLATYALLALSPASSSGIFSPAEIAILYVIGILASEGPDIDLIKYYFEEKNKRNSSNIVDVDNVFDANDSNNCNNTDSNHRNNITHAPLFWLAISFSIGVFGLILGSNFIYYVGWTVLVGSWTHFLLDSIEYGIRWFWPFSNKRFCLIQLDESKISEILTETDTKKGTFSYHWKYIKKSYLKQWTFYAELIIVIITLLILVN